MFLSGLDVCSVIKPPYWNFWVGAHSIILKGVTIGARSTIGAGSVVTKSIPAGCVAAGNPCKVIKKLEMSIKIKNIETLHFCGICKMGYPMAYNTLPNPIR